MFISGLIEELQSILKNQGDLPVVNVDDEALQFVSFDNTEVGEVAILEFDES